MSVTPDNRCPFTLPAVREALAGHTPFIAEPGAAPRNAAVAMILREGQGGLETLFIKRAEYEGDPWSGQMAFPGGRQDPEDDTVEHAARRETLEEVGIPLPADSCWGRLDDLVGGRLASQRLSVTPFVFYHPEPPPVTPNYEVAATVWIPLSHLADPKNVHPYVFPIDPYAREFPAFRYEGYTIWGLTFRIVANFMKLFGIDHPGEPKVTDVE